MTVIKNANTPIYNQPPVIVENVPNNVRRVNFKAENDSFVKQKTPVYTQPPMLDQQAAMRRALEEQKKAQKNQKVKQNISWAAGVLSAVAIIAMVAMSFRTMRGTAADENLIKIIKPTKIANAPILLKMFPRNNCSKLEVSLTSLS